MNTSTPALTRLKHEIKLKEFFENNVRDCGFRASEAIYELFEPYLDQIRRQIKKPNYELGVQAWVNERLIGISNRVDVIEFIFNWEPLKQNTRHKFHEAEFSLAEMQLIGLYFQEFSAQVGFLVDFAVGW